MEVRVARSVAEVESLEHAWNELFRVSGEDRVFCAHAWIRSVYGNYTEMHPLLLLAYSSEQQLVGVFPFAVRDMSLKWLRFRTLVHGASDRADYSSFLISPEANERVTIARVVRKLVELQQAGEWAVYAVNNLSESDGRSGLFRELLLRETFGSAVRSDITPRILLDRGFEEAKKVSNIKRRFRKLTETAEVNVTIGITLDLALLERLVSLHARSYANAAFNSARGQEFFRSLVRDPTFKEFIEVSMVEVGDEIIAAHFGFRCNQRLFYYVPMFDERYAQYGPGQYLLWRMVTHYRDAGFHEFDFLRGGEDYKFQWMNTCTGNFRIWAVGREAPWWRKVMVRILLCRDALERAPVPQ